MPAVLRIYAPDGKSIFDSARDRVLSYVTAVNRGESIPKSPNGAPLYTAYTFRIYDPRITSSNTLAIVKVVSTTPQYIVGGVPYLFTLDAMTRVAYSSGYLDYTVYCKPNYSSAYVMNVLIKLYRR